MLEQPFFICLWLLAHYGEAASKLLCKSNLLKGILPPNYEETTVDE
jgi:hypothetical protein